MGCGTSNAVVPLGAHSKKDVRKISVLVENPPVINITGRDNAKFVASPATKVLFIFGGPGSGKGRVVANLRSMFGMKLVSGESLIFKHLPKKVQHAMTLNNTCDMAALVRKDPSHVQLDWVLRLLQHTIDSDPDQTYLVDLVPNLRWLIRDEHLIKECSQEMAAFENKIPVSFAINLCVKETSLKQTLDYSHHNATLPPGATVSDEADNSRAVRRYKMAMTAINPFLQYFKDSNRLVSVDVSSGAMDPIWDAVQQLFISLDLAAWRPVNSVLVFALGGLQIGRLDLADCDMKLVVLKDIAPDPAAPIDELVDVLAQHMDALAHTDHYFVVDPSCTTMAEPNMINNQSSKKGITFLDTRESEACVNKFSSRLNSLTDLPQPYFKAVCSSEDETLVFPIDTDNSFCQQIALAMAEKHLSMSS